LFQPEAAGFFHRGIRARGGQAGAGLRGDANFECLQGVKQIFSGLEAVKRLEMVDQRLDVAFGFRGKGDGF
jgi:hypothetical protein